MAATGGGVLAICDFVGSDKSLQICPAPVGARRQSGRHRAARRQFLDRRREFGIMAITIEGTLTGTLTEAQELLDLARTKNIAPAVAAMS
jgi:D-arabinose 1-dehydrogenase-like Zn-dependent alcohol dehydrogenase